MTKDIEIAELEPQKGGFGAAIKRITKAPTAYLAWAFFLPALLMFAIYAALGTYPFGESSVLVLDLNGQYVYFFEALRDLVYGEGDFLYSFGRALGGEFLGIYAYYLASPLSYIVCLFPKHAILEALYAMFVIKCGLCGLTFGYYLHATGKVKGKSANVMFSTMYALCAYNVVYQHNTMWIDCVFLLPLVALGIEKLISERKHMLFTVSLALAILSNYYIGYMMCIFVLAYSVYYYFSIPKTESDVFGERCHFLRSVMRVAAFSLIAIAISMMITLPAVYALSFGKDDFQTAGLDISNPLAIIENFKKNPHFKLTQRFDFIDLFGKFFAGAYDNVRPDGLPNVYSGMLALILLPLYFLNSKRAKSERIGTALFIVFFILCFNFNPIDMAWHGFAIPNWLNYRYSFMLSFILIVAARRAYDSLAESGPRVLLATCLALAFSLLVMQKMGSKGVGDFECVWLSLAFITIYCIALSLATRTRTKETSAMIMCVIVALEMFCSGLLGLVQLDEDVVISSYTSYHEFIDEIQPIIDEVKAEDTSFYRMEKNDHRKVCDPYAIGIRGLSGSTSTLNKETILFLQRMGYSSKSHWSKYLGGTPLSDSLLGIKYLVTKTSDSTVHPSWGDIYKTDEENGYQVYLNPYAMAIAYVVNDDIQDLYFSDPNPADLYSAYEDAEYTESEDPIELPELIPYEQLNNPFERMNAMVTAMLGADEEIKLFKRIKDVDATMNNLNMSFAGGHKKYSPRTTGVDASLEYKVTPEVDGIIYCYFASNYPREAKLTVNGTSYGTYFGNETQRIVSLGERDTARDISVKLTLTQADMYIMNGETDFFWYIDEAVYEEVMSKLVQGNMQIEEYTESYFKGTVTTSEEFSTVFTSLPYDEGWQVYVDGEKVEIFKSLDALIAFEIEGEYGEHDVVIKYRPAAVRNGIIITVIGIVLLVLISVYNKKLDIFFEGFFGDDRYPNGDRALAEAEAAAAVEAAEAEAEANPAEAVNTEAVNTEAAEPSPATNASSAFSAIIPDSEVLDRSAPLPRREETPKTAKEEQKPKMPKKRFSNNSSLLIAIGIFLILQIVILAAIVSLYIETAKNQPIDNTDTPQQTTADINSLVNDILNDKLDSFIDSAVDDVYDNINNIQGELGGIKDDINDINNALTATDTAKPAETEKPTEDDTLKWIVYTVKEGDTLYSICVDNGIDITSAFNTIVSVNGLDDPSVLYIGQELILPKK
ncbi:MAG: YfhO family protein [Clostridia bacterium]|nr:YfhO family protein [Clostridia bacterium]